MTGTSRLSCLALIVPEMVLESLGYLHHFLSLLVFYHLDSESYIFTYP